MPFKSQDQRAYMWAKHPELAREFEEATPKGKKLPRRVRRKMTHNSARNPMRLDPSRTALLRRAFQAEIRRRFDRLRRLIWDFVVRKDGLGLGKLTTNAPTFKFETDDQKLRKFNRWFKQQVDQGILSVHPVSGEPMGGKPWFHKYVDSAWRQGLVRAYTDTRGAELGKSLDFYKGSKSQFLQTAFASPERVSKLRLLYTRTYEDLKGITAQMSTQISRVLADGIAHGRGPMEVGRMMSKTITGMPRMRANVIARTEIIHAHAEGQLDGMEDLGVENVGAEVEFTTAGDDGVCAECEDLEGEIFTVDEARGKIPVHPNCRCAWMPVLSV